MSLIVLVVGLACFIQSVRYEFVFDDQLFVVENPAIRTLARPWRFLTDSSTYAGGDGRWYIYRPLATFTFALNYSVDGLEPRGYHLVNAVVHALNGALLYLLLLRLFGRWVPALTGALLFVVHPVQTEAVTWVAGRGNVLFLFFMLLAMLAHVRQFEHQGRCRLLWQVLAALGYVLALLSKEHAIVLPGLLFLHEFLLVKPEVRGSWPRRLPYYTALAVIMAGYLLTRHLVLGQTRQCGYWGGGLYATVCTMIPVGLIYLRLMLFPAWLRVVYHEADYIRTALWSAPVLVGLAVELGILAAAVICYRRKPLITFAVGCVVLGFAPVSNLVPMGAIVNERFMYLPMIGFSMLVGLAVGWSSLRLRRLRPQLAHVLGTGVFVILLCLAVLTVERNRAWRNAQTLFEPNVALAPRSWKVHNNLGTSFMRQNVLDKAVREFREVLRLAPHESEPHYNLALIHMQQNLPKEAVKEYAEVIRLAPQNVAAHVGLGAALLNLGRIDEAEVALRKLEDIDPNYPGRHGNLGKIHQVRGEWKEAEREFVEALRLEPEHGGLVADLRNTRTVITLVPRARRLGDRGVYDEAAHNYLQALSAVPYAASLRLELAQLYLKQDRTAEGIVELEKAFQVNCRDEKIIVDLARLLHRTGASERASGLLRHVLSELPKQDPLRGKLEAELLRLGTSSRQNR